MLSTENGIVKIIALENMLKYPANKKPENYFSKRPVYKHYSVLVKSGIFKK